MIDQWTRRLRDAGRSSASLAGWTMHRLRVEAELLDAGPIPNFPHVGVIGFDTETKRIAPGRLAPPIVCGSFAWTEGGKIQTALLDRPTTVVALRHILRKTTTTSTIHNAAFDSGALAAADPTLWPDLWRAYDAGRIRCTMIRELLLAVASGDANRRTPRSDLDSCAQRHLSESVAGKHGPDAWRFRYHELEGIPIEDWPADAVSYATMDAVYHLRVYHAQEQVGALFGVQSPGEMLPDELWQTRAAWALHLLACWGFRTNPSKVAELRGDLEGRVKEATKRLGGLGFIRDNKKQSRNMSAIAKAVVDAYTALGKDTPMTDGTMNPDGSVKSAPKVSCAGDVLRDAPCADGELCTDDEACSEPLHILARRNTDDGELSKYVRWLEAGVEGPVNARCSPLKATGRCSFAKPPVQQLPRRPGVRETIVARPEKVLIGADYAAAELVTLAQVLIDLLGESELANTLNAGIDAHLKTGAAILEIPLEEAIARRKEPEIKDARQLAKALNFGLPGGLGFATFVKYAWGTWGVRVTEGRARRLKEMWLDLYPEIREYLAWIGEQVEDGGNRFDLIQPKSGRLRGGCGYCDSANSFFQGLAADACKRALYHVQRVCWPSDEPPGPLFGVRPILVLHDEIIAEAKEATAPEAAEELARIMVADLAALCPDLEPACAAEPWISRYWSKAAETVRDGNDRLVVWEASP